MTDNIEQFPSAPDMIKAMTGPCPTGCAVIIEGRVIPRLTMIDEGESVCLILDERLSITVPRDVAYQAAWLAASALAVGMGYSHIGAQNKDRPFAPLAAQLGETP